MYYLQNAVLVARNISGKNYLYITKRVIFSSIILTHYLQNVGKT